MSTAFNMALGTGVIIGFGALALDLGYANFARTQVQAAADASALAGAISLSADDGDTSGMVSQAQTWGQSNAVGSIAVVVDSGDVQRGTLASDGTFTSGATGLDVWVRAHTEGSTGFLSRIWGVSDLDAQATAVARVLPDAVCTYIGTGDTTSNGGGSMVIVGYDSSIDFDPANSPDEQAAICSNASITLNGGGTTVEGAVRPGIGESISGDTSGITGSTAPLGTVLDYPELPQPVGAVNWPLSSNINSAVVIPPGDYKLTGDLKIVGNGQITISPPGPVNIYTNNYGISIAGNGFINTSEDPHNLAIYGKGTAADVKVTGNSDFYGYIYVPFSDVTLGGTAAFYGAIVSDELTFNGGGNQTLYMDTSLMDDVQKGGIKLVQ
jgi:hypothetical protein